MNDEGLIAVLGQQIRVDIRSGHRNTVGAVQPNRGKP
jgi:hypothetical protein